MKKVLVTGGAGFIGHHLVNELIKSDCVVYIVDDFSNSVIDPLSYWEDKVRNVLPQMIEYYDIESDSKRPRIIVLSGDYANQSITKLVSSGTFDTVYHLAAKPRVEWSVENPIESTDENMFKVLSLAKACSSGNTRLVFSSTAAVYGNTDCLPTSESDLKDPQSPYGLSKLCVEKYLHLFNNLYGLDWVALRYFNVYGPAQPGNSPYSTVVSAWCHKALSAEPLRSDGDGTQTRDMIHVYDVVSANIAVAAAKNLNQRIFNVGSSKSISNNDIRKYFEQRGFTNVTHAPSRVGDVKHTLADISEITKLGWKPQIDFDEGINSVLDYWNV